MPTSSSENHPGHCIEGLNAAVYSCPGVDAGNVTQVTSSICGASAPSRQYVNSHRSLASCAFIVRPSIRKRFSIEWPIEMNFQRPLHTAYLLVQASCETETHAIFRSHEDVFSQIN